MIEIKKYLEQGLTLRQIASLMQTTEKNILKKIRRGK